MTIRSRLTLHQEVVLHRVSHQLQTTPPVYLALLYGISGADIRLVSCEVKHTPLRVTNNNCTASRVNATSVECRFPCVACQFFGLIKVPQPQCAVVSGRYG